MSDYIKREMAEVALGSMSMLDGKIFVEDAIAKISRLPSADVVERKRGEWRNYQGDIWYCSACQKGLICDDIKENYFCPNCGASMVAEQTEPITNCDIDCSWK